jgi:hypothetical protein
MAEPAVPASVVVLVLRVDDDDASLCLRSEVEVETDQPVGYLPAHRVRDGRHLPT